MIKMIRMREKIRGIRNMRTFLSIAFASFVTAAVSRMEVGLLYLQTTLERISKLPQATSQTPAIKHFTVADKKGFENDIENQRNWNDAVIDIQEIK